MNASAKPLKELVWIASSLKDFRRFPGEVKHDMGYALFLAQQGKTHASAKPLRGFGGAGVLELVEQHAGNAYRAVYTIRLTSAVYVLHAFQKKAKTGIATPSAEIDLVRRRLRAAETIHRTRSGEDA